MSLVGYNAEVSHFKQPNQCGKQRCVRFQCIDAPCCERLSPYSFAEFLGAQQLRTGIVDVRKLAIDSDADIDKLAEPLNLWRICLMYYVWLASTSPQLEPSGSGRPDSLRPRYSAASLRPENGRCLVANPPEHAACAAGLPRTLPRQDSAHWPLDIRDVSFNGTPASPSEKADYIRRNAMNRRAN